MDSEQILKILIPAVAILGPIVYGYINDAKEKAAKRRAGMHGRRPEVHDFTAHSPAPQRPYRYISVPEAAPAAKPEAEAPSKARTPFLKGESVENPAVAKEAVMPELAEEQSTEAAREAADNLRSAIIWGEILKRKF